MTTTAMTDARILVGCLVSYCLCKYELVDLTPSGGVPAQAEYMNDRCIHCLMSCNIVRLLKLTTV